MVQQRVLSFSFSILRRQHPQISKIHSRDYAYTTTTKFPTRVRAYSTSLAVLDKKRILFLGTPGVAATTLRTLHEKSTEEDCPYEIVGVVTQPVKRRKRNKKPEPSCVGKAAEELGITLLSPEKAKDKDFLDQLETEMKPDLCITAAYGQYLPKRFLATPTLGTINIHPSLLPRWRGASPVQRSLETGDSNVGVTVLYTVSKMDAGPIIVQKEKEVGENDLSDDVLPLLFDMGTQCVVDMLPDICSGKITFENSQVQDESKVVDAKMIHSSEAELRVWEESALTCHNRLRGFSMWPKVFFYVRVEGIDKDIKVKIFVSRVRTEKEEPTNVLKLGPGKKNGIFLVCGDGSVLEILQLQPATRKVMDAKSFMNGYPGKTITWIKTPEEVLKYL